MTSIAAGHSYTLVSLDDGTVRAWGYNFNGQLGDGTTTRSSVPVQAVGLTGVREVGAGDRWSFAIMADGSVWGWGENRSTLGNGTTVEAHVPEVLPAWRPGSVTRIVGGELHTIATKSDGTVWGAGFNDIGQLGDGTLSVPRPTPVQVVQAWNPAPRVTANTLFGVRVSSLAEFSWTSTGSGSWNVHRSADKTELSSIWLLTPFATASTPVWNDAEPPPAPAQPWFYQVFGADCLGSSLP